MCKRPKHWQTITTIFIMQCASWPEAMAEACEDTCHRCRISWMQRTFWKCGMDTKFCHTPVRTCYQVVNCFFWKTYTIDINQPHSGSLARWSTLCFPEQPVHTMVWLAFYSNICSWFSKKKTWNMEFFGNEFCKSWIDLLVFMSTTSATARAHFTTPEVLPALAVHGCVQHLLG